MQPLHDHIAKDGFRLRGTEMSRIDAFSDVVFGFALTLIVVSLDVPKTFSDLHNLLRGFFPFAVTFLMLMLVWFTHYKFFRRYGTHDMGTIWLDPSLATTTRTVAVDVDLDRGANYGATLSWTAENQPHLGEPTVTAVLAVDAPKIRKLFLENVSRPSR